MTGSVSGAGDFAEIQAGGTATEGLVHTDTGGGGFPVRVTGDRVLRESVERVRNVGIHDAHGPFYRILYFCC